MLAWGKIVSEEFRVKTINICRELVIDPNFMMACMAFETGETFSPSIRNKSGSGAVGLIQFIPPTAQALGTTTEELILMTAETQLDYVRKYFKPRKGALRTLEDVYMAILWPGGIGKPLDYVLFDKNDPSHPKRYVQNAGLDFNRDGKITKKEASGKVRKKLEKGLRPDYVWTGE